MQAVRENHQTFLSSIRLFQEVAASFQVAAAFEVAADAFEVAAGTSARNARLRKCATSTNGLAINK